MNVHVVRGADGLNRRAFSAEDVRRMIEAGILGEDDPFELIDGELIEMSPKGHGHDLFRNALAGEFFRHLGRDLYIAVESTLRLDAHTLVEPDLLICRKSSVRKSEEGYVEVPGPQILLIVEVSVSSLAFDRRRKAAVYAVHGVPEYWVVDPNGQRAFIHHQPAQGKYSEVQVRQAREPIRPLAPELAAVQVLLAELD